MEKKIIIAHKGGLSLAYKNTIEALKKSIELGVDIIGLDVRKTIDGVLIAYHDAEIQGKRVNELTYDEIIKISKNLGFRIAKLEDILLLSHGKIKLSFELKEKGYEIEALRLIFQYFSEDEFIITSFNNSSLIEVKDKFPHVKVGLILGEKDNQNRQAEY